MFRLLILFVILTVVSCKRVEKPKGSAIARVYDNFLYKDEVINMIPKGTKPADSLALVKKYISHWQTEVLVLHRAETQLTEEQKNVARQLRDYRNSLVTYAYEKELVHSKLDTTIGREEIEAYYNQHKSNFELKDNIIKVIYVKVSKKATHLEKLKQWYKSDDKKDRQQLEQYCKQYAENYFLDDNTWLLFDDLLKEIPIQPAYNKESFLQNNHFVEVSDADFLYFVNIKGFQIKNSISPLAFERANIRNIILNKRKLDLILKMKEEAEREARANHEIENFL